MMAAGMHQTRDSIEDIWGCRTPYKHQWPTRVDERVTDTPEKWVQSACVLCSHGCALDIGVKDGKVVGVRGRATDRANKGRLGPKGLHGWASINSQDRLKYPMIRRNGKLERASWDETMSYIVSRTQDIRSRLSNHGIGFYTSGQLFLEEYYVLAMVGKAGLHTLHMDGNTRLCTATAAASMRESFGSDGQPGSYGDIDYTDCMFLYGHNPAATATVMWSRILDRLDGPNPPKLICVDPRTTAVAKRATVHLAPKVGTNLALLNGIQHLMFKHGWVDEKWVAKHTVGVEKLRETVAKYHPKYVEDITGVPAADLKRAAEIIGTTPSLLSTTLQGIYQSNQATASACQLNNISLLRGLIGKQGSGVLQMNGQPTAQNNRESGCDGEYPAFRNNQNPQHMKEIADCWNIRLIEVPHWSQPTHLESMLSFAEEGSIEMLWVSGTNPLVSLPDLPKMRKLFTKPDLFLIVQDIFLTETAEVADVVLPAAQWGERTGTFTNVDRTVHLSHKAVDPPGEARSDLDIFLDFAKRMGFEDKDGNDLIPWTQPEEVFEAWKKMTKGRPCDYTGLSYEKLTGGSGIQWPCNEDYPNGRERLFDDGKFFTDIDYCESYGHDLDTGVPFTKIQYEALNPAGRAILKAADYQSPMEEPDEEYPIRLSTGRNVYQFHTRTKTGRAPQLHKACPRPLVQISEQDASAAGIKDSDEVVVKSRRGAVQMPVNVGNIAPGHAFIPFHFGYWDLKGDRARAANELTIKQWDPISKQPTFKAGAVKIEKCKDEPGLVRIHAKEEQTAAVKRVSKGKKVTSKEEKEHRSRRLELWLGATDEAIQELIDIYDHLIPKLVHNQEVHWGLKMMHHLADDVLNTLKPSVEKYHGSKKYGRAVSGALRDALFPKTVDGDGGSYSSLTGLQALHMYLSHIEGQLTALVPTSQALWDEEFADAVKVALKGISRQQAWAMQHVKVMSPQMLLVPMIPTRDLEDDPGSLGVRLREVSDSDMV